MLEITDFVKTLNPVCGCTRGCNYCYAKNINNRFKIIPDFSKPRFMERSFNRIGTKKPNTYLMTSMSDFSDWTTKWKQRVFDKMKDNPQHNYLFLSKSPEKIQFKPDMPNVWMGVTVTNKSDIDRINYLTAYLEFKNYFITFEPLFENIGILNLRNIGWVVIGTETGNRRGKITAEREWVMGIVKQTKTLNIPIFMKSTMASIVGENDLYQEVPPSFG